MANHPATPKLNFLVQPKTDTKCLSKSMKYFFVMIHVVFALDFGFIKFKSPKMNLIIKLITLAQSTALFLIVSLELIGSSYNISVYTYCAFFTDILLYYLCCLTLAVVKNTYYRDFQTDLNSFDAEINVDSSTSRVEYKIIMWFSLMIAYRIYSVLLYCLFFLDFCDSSIYVRIIYCIGLVGTDTIPAVYSFVFYSAYLRLIHFTSFVDGDGTDVISCHYLYKSLAEMIEKVKKSFDVLLIFILVANTTDVIIHIYLPFAKDTVKSDNAQDMAAAYAIVAQQLLLLFAPAFTAGLLAGQAEKLILVLHDKLIKEDQTCSKDIKRFVAYIEGRPLRFKVWRVVPLDWRLPVIVINVTVTYLIVMIQFTHVD